jgi:hypothetical protein
MKARRLAPPRRAAAVLLIAMLLLAQAGGPGAAARPAQPPGEEAGVSVEVEGPHAQAPVVIDEVPEVDRSAYRRLESGLASLYESAVLGIGRPAESFAGQAHIDLKAGTARVIVEMDADPEAYPAGPATLEQVVLEDGRTAAIEHAPPIAIRADLEAAIAATGARYETAYRSWVQVLAPIGSLPALAQMDGVRVVRLPYPAMQSEVEVVPGGDAAPEAGSVTSEGASLTGIDPWHAAGYDGSGIQVAIFDWGFDDWGLRQASGDLPSGTDLVLKDFAGTYDFGSPSTPPYKHGTACAEIAYDMAPSSTVYLYAAYTDAELGLAIDDYRTNVTGRRVASMSLGWVNAGPYDGTGPIDAMVDDAAASGILFAVASGNQQRRHHSWTSAQYGSTDYTTFGGSDPYEEFGPAAGWWHNIGANRHVTAFLEWDDWDAARTGNSVGTDYDMVLERSTDSGATWSSVASSTNRQCSDASVPPMEAIDYTNPGTAWFRLYVVRHEEAGCSNSFGHWMQLHSWVNIGTSGTLWVHRNPCNSVLIPAEADGAVSTGAVLWSADGTSPLYGLEYYSGLGPRNAAGGADPGAAVNKPDVVGPDGVSTASYGTRNFYGTSAAAPHTAGLAASVWERWPTSPASEIRDKVQTYALYRAAGSCGGSLVQSTTQNNTYGWGRIAVGDPTSVFLTRFEAWPEGRAIHVQWETSQEIDNVGFNLYRADRLDGSKLQLNQELIPSRVPPGSAFGAVYDWMDRHKLRKGRTYSYWLEDVDIYGVKTLHGPVQATAP